MVVVETPSFFETCAYLCEEGKMWPRDFPHQKQGERTKEVCSNKLLTLKAAVAFGTIWIILLEWRFSVKWKTYWALTHSLLHVGEYSLWVCVCEDLCAWQVSFIQLKASMFVCGFLIYSLPSQKHILEWIWKNRNLIQCFFLFVTTGFQMKLLWI